MSLPSQLQSRRLRRVLLYTESGVPSRYWEAAAACLIDEGLEPYLMTTRARGPLHDAFEKLGCVTGALGAETALDYPRTILRLRRFLRVHRIDILHASEPIQAVIGGIAALTSSCRLRLFHRHHTQIGGAQRALSFLGTRLNQRTMAVSQAAAESAVRWDRERPARICVAHNGIPHPRHVSELERLELKESLGIPRDQAVVLMVARMRPEKGHVTLLKAVARLDRDGIRPHVVIVGGGNEALRSDFERVRDSESLNHVLFVGHQEDVAPWYAIADVVVVPSERESFNLVAVESMAARRPVVASSTGGLSEVLSNGCGALVPPTDPAALGDALRELLLDTHRRGALAEDGYRRFEERYTTVRMVKGWISCYRKVLNRAVR